jgi:hypothetical protein
MSSKEQLLNLQKDVHWYLVNGVKWEETTPTYSVGYDAFTNEFLGLLPFGTFTFNNEPIAEIDRNMVVHSVRWNDDYSPEMRAIFEALEVEVHRFGKIWVGYPNEDPITCRELGTYLPDKVRRVREEKQAREIEEAGLRNMADRARIDAYYKDAIDKTVFTTSTTSTPAFGGYNTNSYYAFNANDNYASIGNSFTSNNRPPAANPSIASANQQGRSQRQIEEMIRRGRV